MGQYEIAVLYDQGLELDLEKATDKVASIIKANGGTITAEDNWGKKKLAYPIRKQDFAIYVFYTVELPAESVKKVNDTLNITDEVVRFLITKVDPKKQAKIEAAKTKRDARVEKQVEKVEEESEE